MPASRFETTRDPIVSFQITSNGSNQLLGKAFAARQSTAPLNQSKTDVDRNKRKSLSFKPYSGPSVRDVGIPSRTSYLPIQPLRAIQAQLVKEDSANTSNAASAHHVNLTLPFGLYQVRHIPFQGKELRGVVDLPEKKHRGLPCITTLDPKGVCLWNNNMSAMLNRVPFHTKARRKPDGIRGFSKWIHSVACECFVVGGDSVDLRVLDLSFVERASVISLRTVLCLSYIESRQEVISGEIGGMHVYRLIKKTFKTKSTYELQSRLDITDVDSDNWVSNVSYEANIKKLFGMNETELAVYDVETGIRLYTINTAANDIGTSIAYYSPLGYLIIGSRSGKVRVWSSTLKPVHEFRGHTQEISNLALLEPSESNSLSWGMLPICVSSSFDGSIRLWHLETGDCLQRVDIGQPIIQMTFASPDTLISVTNDDIHHWNIGRHLLLFTHLGSTPVLLRRLQTTPARILCATVDGAIRFLSPVSGQTLSIGFPSLANIELKSIEYDVPRSLIYAFGNSTCFVYDTSSNPMIIVAEWKTDPSHTTFCGISDYDNSRNFELLAGATDGKIFRLDLYNKLAPERLALAHAGPISILSYNSTNNTLISYGNDLSLKIWNIALSTEGDVSAISLSLLRLIPLQEGPTSRIHCVNPSIPAFVCEFSSHLHAIPYLSNHSKLVLQDHAALPPKAIDSLPLFNCYASVSADGTVKVWDSDGLLAREVQIGSKSQSMCFANQRGDLLVGTESGIAIVRCQDYMPPNLLQRILEGCPRDDIMESPHPFGDGTLVWRYMNQKTRDSEQRDPEAERTVLGRYYSAAECKLRLPTRQELLARQERIANAATFSNRETVLFQLSDSQTQALPFTDTNPAHSWQSHNNLNKPMETMESQLGSIDIGSSMTAISSDAVRNSGDDDSVELEKLALVHAAVLKVFESATSLTQPTPSKQHTTMTSPNLNRGALTLEGRVNREMRRLTNRQALTEHGLVVPNSIVIRDKTDSNKARESLIEPKIIKKWVPPTIKRAQSALIVPEWEDEVFEVKKDEKKSGETSPAASESSKNEPSDIDSAEEEEGSDTADDGSTESATDDNNVARQGQTNQVRSRHQLDMIATLPLSSSNPSHIEGANTQTSYGDDTGVNHRMESSIDILTEVEREVAESYTWELMKIASLEHQIPEETPKHHQSSEYDKHLMKVAGKSWFPGLGGLTLNVLNLIQVVVKVLRNADKYQDRCEASIALLYLAVAYRGDIRDPERVFIQPILEAMADVSTHGRVRAVCCAHILAFGIWSTDVIAGIVSRLLDPSEQVRMTAMKALMKVGINTTDALRCTLVRLGARVQQPLDSTYIALDIILANTSREKLSKKLYGSNPEVEAWRKTVPQYLEEPCGLTRQPSYYQHLAGHFFKEPTRHNHSCFSPEGVSMVRGKNHHQSLVPDLLQSGVAKNADDNDYDEIFTNKHGLSAYDSDYERHDDVIVHGQQQQLSRPETAYTLSRPTTQSDFTRAQSIFKTVSTRPSSAMPSSRATTAKASSRPLTREHPQRTISSGFL